MKRVANPKQRPWKPGGKKMRETVALSLGGKLTIVGSIVASVAVIIGTAIFESKIKHAKHLEDDLKSLAARYHLNDEQLRETRHLEEQFHGSGNPFTRRAHTFEEEQEHLLKHSRAMSPEDGARFLAEQEKRVSKKGRASSPH